MESTLILATLLATTTLWTSCPDIAAYEHFEHAEHVQHIDRADIPQNQFRLTDSERDLIYRQAQFAIKKMNLCIERAEREADKIYDWEVRDITRSAIQGAVCASPGRNGYAMAIGACINVLSYVSGELCDYFYNARDYMYDAKFYAYEADRLEERLWRDE